MSTFENTSSFFGELVGRIIPPQLSTNEAFTEMFTPNDDGSKEFWRSGGRTRCFSDGAVETRIRSRTVVPENARVGDIMGWGCADKAKCSGQNSIV
jgi:hypothetical protein